MIKIVYIHPSQLSERWIKYYCLEELKKNFDLEYWDCSMISSPSFQSNALITTNYLHIIKSYKEFEDNLKRIPKDSLLVIDLHRTLGNLKLYKVIRRYFKNRILINFFSNTQRAYKNKYLAKIKESTIGDFYTYFIVRKMFSCFTMSSLVGIKYRINHPDYEEFLVSKNKEPIINSPYIVYVDNYFPLHPEIEKRNPSFKAKELASDFYNSLNSYFQELESYFSCNVVIAAHPSSNYKCNPFNGRKIIYNQTCRLIKDCLKVCMHTSNSISYVILYDKPVVLLSNSVFRQADNEYKRLKGVSELMKVEIVDTDMPFDCRAFKKIDKIYAEEYRNAYLIANDGIPNAIKFKQYFEEIYQDIR